MFVAVGVVGDRFIGRADEPPHMSDDLTEYVDGIVHEPTQTEGAGLDLTVAAVHRVDTPGRIDFGGGELESAELAPVETEKRNPDDEYGWWNLDEGQYLLAYNESLTVEHSTFLLKPRIELVERGAFHPTLRVGKLPQVPLAVGGGGIRIKENARVSTLSSP